MPSVLLCQRSSGKSDLMLTLSGLFYCRAGLWCEAFSGVVSDQNIGCLLVSAFRNPFFMTTFGIFSIFHVIAEQVGVWFMVVALGIVCWVFQLQNRQRP